MQTHRWISHGRHAAPKWPVEIYPLALRANPAGSAARRALILAFALGSLGAAAAATTGQATADHANLPTASVNAAGTASHDPIVGVSDGWMY
jgi:hypothetical protein